MLGKAASFFMEKGSAAPGGSGSRLEGLSIGKKIYFEDAGGGSSSSPCVGARKRRQSKGRPAPPPRCQVEGCKEDLSGAKAYYCRHRVCGAHSKAPEVVVNGLEQRFCQQCSRFHQLPEFDQGKRSCRRRLAGHNERRRKPPPEPIALHYGQLPTFEEHCRLGSLLMDIRYPNPPIASQAAWFGHLAAHPFPGPVDLFPSSRISDTAIRPCIHGSASGITHQEIQQSHHLGVADSNCALSLLSIQPWGSNAASSRESPISGNHCQATPVDQSPVSLGFTHGHWGLEAGGVSHAMGLETAALPGDLELQRYGHAKNYDRGDLIHWSL